MTDQPPVRSEPPTDMERLALEFHKTIEGEYGCPGLTCPGVQRLIVAFVALKGHGQREDEWTYAGRVGDTICSRGGVEAAPPVPQEPPQPKDTGPLPVEAVLRQWDMEVKHYEGQSDSTSALMALTLRTCLGQIRRAFADIPRTAAGPLGDVPAPPTEDLRSEIATVLKQVEMTAYRADAIPPNYQTKPTLDEWRERVTWLVSVLTKVATVMNTPTERERKLSTKYAGAIGDIPVYSIDGALSPDAPFEYDQGHAVVVWYDDLYNLVHPRPAVASRVVPPQPADEKK